MQKARKPSIVGRMGRLVGLLVAVFGLLALSAAQPAFARYASLIMDASTGEVLHEINADTRNYPASLTKMMTLYKVFEALDNGKLKLHQKLTVSRRAAGQAPSKLGLKAGQTISVENAILALVTKSANDVATVVAEALGNTESQFALQMTATARKLGMNSTTFRNASGLPNRAQMSTARDMATLGLALIRNYPQYYHYFSAESFSYGGRRHGNHNALLTSYEGTDGIKTGYTRASGFNLVTSVHRDGRHLIGVVFGGRTASARNSHMVRLLDKGFSQLDVIRQARNEPRAAPLPAPQIAQGDADDSSALDLADVTPPPLPPGRQWGIQVGAYHDYNMAREAAAKAVTKVASLQASGEIRVVPLEKGRKTIYRSRILGLTKAVAYDACRLLKRAKVDCMELKVKDDLQVAAR